METKPRYKSFDEWWEKIGKKAIDVNVKELCLNVWDEAVQGTWVMADQECKEKIEAVKARYEKSIRTMKKDNLILYILIVAFSGLLLLSTIWQILR